MDLFVDLWQLHASFTYFGDLLRCPHKRIVTTTKVYIARNNMQVQFIRFHQKVSPLFTFTFAKRGTLGPLYVYNIPHSVYDSLDRLATASERTSSILKKECYISGV